MANVSFSRDEFDQFCTEQELADNARLWEELHSVHSNGALETLMERANNMLGGSGVEAIRIEGADAGRYYGDIVATYVNFGDTYAETLVLDSASHTFFLTSWGDFVEAYEREHPRLCPVCNDRPAEYNGDTGERDLPCSTCAEGEEKERAPEKEGCRYPHRFFPVQYKYSMFGEVEDTTAYWHRALGEAPILCLDPVRSGSEEFYAPLRDPSTMGNLYYRAGRRLEEVGAFLTLDSVERALVELDRFLEQNG